HGVISVTSNIVPRDVSEMVRLFFTGDMDGARRLHYRLQSLHRSMFIETNPIPVKTALSLMGMMEPEFRLPLVRMPDANRKKLDGALRTYGIKLRKADRHCG
ncbi:MAG: dihydrodipicolinate synthase family protein, partial [Deltaproteobacteria bacterium]|nr:dihydrodipicolinate synthase family protein [Deltaproteobacteria bacterium]